MMNVPIDASIPLSVQQFKLPNPAEVLSLRNLAAQANDADRERQEKNALRQLLQSPGAVDAQGRITPDAIAQATRINSRVGFQLSQQREQLRLQDMAFSQKKIDIANNVGVGYVSAYDRALQTTGGNKQEAQRIALEETHSAIEELKKNGQLAMAGFDDAAIARMENLPDPEKMRVLVTSMGGKIPEKSAPLSNLGKLEADYKANRISKTDYEAQKKKMDAPPKYMIDAAGKGNFEGRNGEILAALAERGVSLPAGFRSKEQQLGLLNSLSKRNPDLTPDQIADKIKSGQIDLANLKVEGRVAAGIAGKVAYAEKEIEQTIPLVREASAKLPRGQFIPWNKLKQMGEKNFSDPDLAEFRMYMTSLSNAYDMLAARGGTDVEKRAESRRNFDTAQSPEALERVLQAVQKEAQASGRAAKESMDVTRKGDTKGSVKAYDDAEKERRYQEWKRQHGG